MNECSCETPRPRHAGVHPTVCQYCNLIIEAESFDADDKFKCGDCGEIDYKCKCYLKDIVCVKCDEWKEDCQCKTPKLRYLFSKDGDGYGEWVNNAESFGADFVECKDESCDTGHCSTCGNCWDGIELSCSKCGDDWSGYSKLLDRELYGAEAESFGADEGGPRNKYKCASCENEYSSWMFPDGFAKHEPVSFCQICLDKEAGSDYDAESFEALITNCPYCSGKKVDDHDASEMAICFKRYLKDSTPNPNAPISTRALNDYMNRQGYQQMNAEEFEAEGDYVYVGDDELAKAKGYKWCLENDRDIQNWIVPEQEQTYFFNQFGQKVSNAESFKDKSPMMQNLTIAAIGALALIIGRKVTR